MGGVGRLWISEAQVAEIEERKDLSLANQSAPDTSKRPNTTNPVGSYASHQTTKGLHTPTDASCCNYISAWLGDAPDIYRSSARQRPTSTTS